VFGENCAASIIVMSATAAEMGRIIDVNEELEHMLGYSRKEMIGQNIRKIIPTPIAKVHDQLI
jgi:PAS domain S-box-containing protein